MVGAIRVEELGGKDWWKRERSDHITMIIKFVRVAGSAYDAATSGFWRYGRIIPVAGVGTYTVA